jgi:hypothetical protein
MNGRILYLLTGVVLAAQAGCQNQGSYRLHLEFPDEASKTSVSLVHVLVLKPLLHTCEELVVSGGIDPRSLAVVSEIELNYPLDSSGSSKITEVPAGDVLFYAEGQNADRGILLKGCSPAKVAGGKTINVTVQMAWWCRPASEDEIPQNNVDDNCDGRTDECAEDKDCRDLNRCTMDFCSEEACHHSAYPDLGTPIQCDDGDLCTLGDTCAEGVCVGTPKDCSSFDGICLEGGLRSCHRNVRAENFCRRDRVRRREVLHNG